MPPARREGKCFTFGGSAYVALAAEVTKGRSACSTSFPWNGGGSYVLPGRRAPSNGVRTPTRPPPYSLQDVRTRRWRGGPYAPRRGAHNGWEVETQSRGSPVSFLLFSSGVSLRMASLIASVSLSSSMKGSSTTACHKNFLPLESMAKSVG
eukprot:scaffold6939_cov28-Tisochrysis_lutea.AAC.2